MPLPSLWQDRLDAPARARTLPPAPDAPWDVVVVGGGLSGVTTALLLGRAGARVLLLEAGPLGQGTTGRSTAKISLLQGLTLSRLRRRHSREALADYVTGHREGQAWLARFCEDHGVAVQHRPAYTYATASSALRGLHAEQRAAEEAGLPVRWQDDLPLPYDTRGGLRLDDQLQVDPLELLRTLADQAEEHDVRIVEGVRVLRVGGGSPVELQVAGERTESTVLADRVVVATNLPFLDRGGFFARMSPERSYSLALRTPEPGRPVDGMFLSVDASTRSLRTAPDPDGGELLLVGGAGHVTGRSTPTSAHLDELRAWTHEWFPGAVETHAWSAQDFSPTRALPYAGPLLPGRDRILVAGGYAKWGMTGAAAAALSLSAQLLGGRVDWADSWQPWQREELTGLPGAVALNAGVGLELARGWVRPLQRSGTGRHVCTHLGGRLTWNDAEQSWDCPLHGSRFGEDGRVLEGPATCPVGSLAGSRDGC